MLNAFALCPLDTRIFDEDALQSESNQSDGVYDSDEEDLFERCDRGGNQCRFKNDSRQQAPSSFREFGVGCLFAHPSGERLFGPIPRQVQYC